MKIIGAGLSGLLAANILRKQNPIILEQKPELPNNHKALLRFRTDKVSQATGIPFERVRVSKQINYDGEIFNQATVAHSNEYAYKVSGEYKTRSIIDLSSAVRYIAPDNLIEQMAQGCDIHYNNKIDSEYFFLDEDPILSTMPMIDLMKLLGWENIPKFKFKSIWTVYFDIESPVIKIYQTTYYPNSELKLYRLSITGNKVIAEFIEEPNFLWRYKGEMLDTKDFIFHFLKRDFGIKLRTHSQPMIWEQKYGKLIESDKKVCKKFISWATQKHNVYSLGRWGTHRQILMDDVVDDIFVINRLIQTGNYGVIKK